MADHSNIEWTDSTLNPWVGCTKVGPGCDGCYAEQLIDRRFGRAKWGPGNPRSRTAPANWHKPKQWNLVSFSECLICGWRGEYPKGCYNSTCPACETEWGLRDARRRVFCASLADWLDNEVPAAWLADLLDLIRLTPNLDWLLLTKRIGNWGRRLDEAALHCHNSFRFELGKWIMEWREGSAPANVWLGSTIVDRDELLRDAPKLASIPARIHFWSVEPMLADLGSIPAALMPQWVIAGGETDQGPHKARPSNPQWFRNLRNQCADAGVPFLFKQWGEWIGVDSPDQMQDASHRYGPTVLCYSWGQDTGAVKIGKKNAGRLLDGVEHNVFPVPA